MLIQTMTTSLIVLVQLILSSSFVNRIHTVSKLEISFLAHVNVYDEVLSPTQCTNLISSISPISSDGFIDVPFTIFNRKTRNLSVIEKIIDDILSELHDESAYVEYWSRSFWISHVLHRDVDEYLASSKDQIRYPRNGHVLYIDYDMGVTGGHTVVLEDDNDTNITSQIRGKRNLYIIPPKPGRLLRFSGHMLHGVPRPALEYVLGDQTSAQLLDSCWPRLQPHDCDGYGDDTPMRRFVILFNTWDNHPTCSSESQEGSDSGGGRVGYWSLTRNMTGRRACSPRRQWIESDMRGIPATTECAVQPSSNDVCVGKTPSLTLRIELPAHRLRRDRCTLIDLLVLFCKLQSTEILLPQRINKGKY